MYKKQGIYFLLFSYFIPLQSIPSIKFVNQKYKKRLLTIRRNLTVKVVNLS